MGWATTELHTAQWTFALLLCLALAALFFAIKRGKGAFAPTICLWIGSLVLIAIDYWFTITNARMFYIFLELSYVLALLGMIFLGQSLEAFQGDAPHWARSSILSIVAAANGGTWIILFLITVSSTFLLWMETVCWGVIQILVLLVLIKVHTQLPAGVPHHAKLLFMIAIILGLVGALISMTWSTIYVLLSLNIYDYSFSGFVHYAAFICNYASQGCFLSMITMTVKDGAEGVAILSDPATKHLIHN